MVVVGLGVGLLVVELVNIRWPGSIIPPPFPPVKLVTRRSPLYSLYTRCNAPEEKKATEIGEKGGISNSGRAHRRVLFSVVIDPC